VDWVGRQHRVGSRRSLLPWGRSKGLLREQNGLLKRIAQGLDSGLGAGIEEEVEDSTIRE